MMKRLFKKNNENGFTLAELLIVVAIIAVLVAISIPIFTTQLEKAREATDAANIRAAYAEIMTAALTEDATTLDENGAEVSNFEKTIEIKQKVASWSTDVDWPEDIADTASANVVPGGTATLTYTPNGAGAIGGTITVSYAGNE